MTAQENIQDKRKRCREFFAVQVGLEQNTMTMIDIVFYMLQKGLVKDFNQAINAFMFAHDHKVIIASEFDSKETFEKRRYYLADSSPF